MKTRLELDALYRQFAIVIVLSCCVGCAIRKPVHALYCEQLTRDGKHCLVWAPHKDLGCVHTTDGTCTAETR